MGIIANCSTAQIIQVQQFNAINRCKRLLIEPGGHTQVLDLRQEMVALIDVRIDNVVS